MAERQKILIVDDREENLFALEHTLEATEAEFVKATSGNEALIASLHHDFALALLDVHMPGMTGFELADHLRKDAKTQSLPIIFLTAAFAQEEHVFQGYGAGAVDYIIKPFNPTVLNAKVKAFLELARYRNQLEDMVQERTERLRHVNQVLRAIRNVNQLIVREPHADRLVRETCKLLVEARGFGGAWIVVADDKGNRTDTAMEGLEENGVACRICLRSERLPPCCSEARSRRGMILLPDWKEQCRECPLISDNGGSHAMVTLMEHEGMLQGFIALHVEATVAVDTEEQSLFQEVAGDIAYALRNIQVGKERQAAQEATNRLAAAVEQAAEAVEMTDPEGTIVYVNPAFEQTTGYSREEALGNNPRIVKSGVHDANFYKRMWNILTQGKTWTGRLTNKKKDGSLIEEEVSITPVKDDAGKIVNYVAVKRDVTREVMLQRQLLQAQKMEAVGTLAGGIAHDFNNILQVTLGYSELILGDRELPGHRREDLKKIYDSARRGADLVMRMLTFSRKTDTKPQPLDLNHRVSEIQKMLERTLPKMIDIHVLPGENLAKINADPVQIDQVLMNLAVNAADAMPEGGKLSIHTANVTLEEHELKEYVEAKPGQQVLLMVTDTGLGMDKNTLEHIFEPFFTTKAVGEGTGLGLAMVHGIVKQHGGHIRCSSTPGRGTSFQVYLPAMVVGEPVEEPNKILFPQGGSETILLVDDEEHIRDLGLKILNAAGYKVIMACNGGEALDVYYERSNEIALVILDLMMPEMGGKQCLERLLKMNPYVKVIISSGYSASGPTKEALSAGAKGFVNKPYDIHRMLDVIREVLDVG